jgi:hypothetical protein
MQAILNAECEFRKADQWILANQQITFKSSGFVPMNTTCLWLLVFISVEWKRESL